MHKQICTLQLVKSLSEPKESLKIRGGGVNSNVVGIICPPSVEIGLTDLPKSRDGTTGTTRDDTPASLCAKKYF